MSPRIQPPNPTQPRSAKEFLFQWDVPKQDDLISGNDQFSNLHKRQDRLVGQILDACIILHVYERLKQKTHFEELHKSFFNGRISRSEIETLEKIPTGNMSDEEKRHVDEEKLKLLVEMSREKIPLKRLRSHRDLIKPSAWQNYVDLYTHYKQQKEDYMAEATLALVNASKPGPAPVPPEDPRIKAINDMIKPTVRLMNSGPKELLAIQSKMRRQGLPAEELRDLNRIGVLPVTPEYRDDFIRIINMLHPPKIIAAEGCNKELQRVFVEAAEIKANGYYNQKLFLALDRDNTAEGITDGNAATIAEIKIVPSALNIADKLTSVTKAVVRRLRDNPEQYTIKNKLDKRHIEKLRIALKADYAEKTDEFEELLTKFKLVDKGKLRYALPDFPKDTELNKVTAYRDLADKLYALSKQIHLDAILYEHPDWQKEYLKTALFQRLCSNKPEFKKDAESVLPTNVQSIDVLDNKAIRQIAEANHWDIKSLETNIKNQITDAHNQARSAAAGK